MNLTAHVLAESETGLAETLASLEPLGCDVLVGAAGPGVVEACRRLGRRAVVVAADRSEARNSLLRLAGTPWHLYLDPGEEMASGHDVIPGAASGPPKRFYVVLGDLVTKEVRLFGPGRKFHGPVCESVQPDGDSVQVDVFVRGVRRPSRLGELLAWKGRSQAAEVDYYLAGEYLSAGDEDKFLNHAKKFIFLETSPTDPAVLMRYYMAAVLLRRRQVREAVGHLMVCLAQKPLMAEFWCLLGDCLLKMGDVGRAGRFYRNAVVMGRSRSAGDRLPVVPSKYRLEPMPAPSA